MTNTPSQQKPWMKYYSPEALCAEMPHCKAFDYILEQNKDRLDAPALHYYGADITFNDLIDRVDQAARAFTALGVKEGDIVSFLSVALPETIACVYALSRIGAAANTIDPRMDVESIKGSSHHIRHQAGKDNHPVRGQFLAPREKDCYETGH